MTPEQIKNWRNVLISALGPYALLMPEADIIAYKNKMQEAIDVREDKRKAKEKENESI